MFPSVYSLPACLISHYSKLIAGKLEGGEKKNLYPEAEKSPVLAEKQSFSPRWCEAVMYTMASLSLIRPRLVSLWDGPQSKAPRPPLEGPRRGLCGAPPLAISLSFHPPPPGSYLPSGDEALPQRRCQKKGLVVEAWEQKIQKEKR